jgi:hypothetical protein
MACDTLLSPSADFGTAGITRRSRISASVAKPEAATPGGFRFSDLRNFRSSSVVRLPNQKEAFVMTTQEKPTGIDVCSGPSLSRAERLAQEAARFAPRHAPGPAANDAKQPAPRPVAAE